MPQELEQAVVFAELANILAELYEKISQSLIFFPKAYQPFSDFSSPDGSIQGSLHTFSGEVFDKLVYSRLQAAPMGFGTLRLTTWLDAVTNVPHLAFEFGTMPNLFFYMDYLPRVDLWADQDYVQQFYAALGATHGDLRNQADLSVFVSKSLTVRQLMSPAHICFTGANTADLLALVREVAHAVCDRWLAWIPEVPLVPVELQADLAARDLMMRRVSAEQDPGNAVVARMLGEEFTQQLVQALWQPEAANPTL